MADSEGRQAGSECGLLVRSNKIEEGGDYEGE